MKKFFSDPENVDENLPGIIVLSHGPLAISLYESAKLIYGPIDNFAALSLEEGDDLALFSEELKQCLSKFPEGSIVLVDVLGGTPCNQLLLCLRANNLKAHVLAGVNLPILLETANARTNLQGKELKEYVYNVGRESIVDVMKLFPDFEL
jgi:PTS system mannose-specific IIA component